MQWIEPPLRRSPAAVSLGLFLFTAAACGCRWGGREDDLPVVVDNATTNAPDPVNVQTEEPLGPPPEFRPGQTSEVPPSTWIPGKSGIRESETLGGDVVEVTPDRPVIDSDSLRGNDPVGGSELNPFFPAQTGDVDRVAKQEKTGFSQYSYRRGGEEFSQLSITDLRSNPAAAEKFRQPDFDVAGHPGVGDGSKGSALLVGGRFQLKVRSPGGQLDAPERIDWLSKFDLDALSDFER